MSKLRTTSELSLPDNEIIEWISREDPQRLEYVFVTASFAQLRGGGDLFDERAWKDPYETSMLSHRLATHQIWRGIRLKIDPYRPMLAGEDRPDRFQLQLNHKLNVIDECLRLAASNWRAAATRHFEKPLLVESGTFITAFVEDPAAKEDMSIHFEIMGLEVTSAMREQVARIVGSPLGRRDDGGGQ